MPNIIQLGILDGRSTSASGVSGRNAWHCTEEDEAAAAQVEVEVRETAAVNLKLKLDGWYGEARRRCFFLGPGLGWRAESGAERMSYHTQFARR